MISIPLQMWAPIVLLGWLALTVQSACWIPPFVPDCTIYNVSNSDPGVTGNLAFTTFYDVTLFPAADAIVKQAEVIYGSDWTTTTKHIDYHISIYYMFCVPQQATTAIHKALAAFKWRALTVTIDHTQCEPGYVEVALDPQSQQVVANFSKSLRHHLVDAGIPIPDLTVLQPPFHIAIGQYNATSTKAIPEFSHTPITQRLDIFYLGTQPYFSSDFPTSGGVFTEIRFAVMIAILAALALEVFFAV